jgi:hypothetical protein
MNLNEEMLPFEEGPNDLDFKLRQMVYSSIGEASMCWDSPKSAGEFQYNEAKKVADKLVVDIKNLLLKI